MHCEVQWIPLENIRPAFDAKIADTYKKRMRKIGAKLQDYDLLLVVEKDQSTNGYILVGGYDKYQYLLDCTDLKAAPCIVENSSTPEEALLKILRRLFPHGDSQKKNKQQVLEILDKLEVTKTRIIKNTPFTMSDLNNNYYINPSIPAEFINENTIPMTLNEVEQLDVSPETKTFLFTRAGLPVGNRDRLTGQVIKIIKSYTKKDKRVRELTSAQQVETFTQAFSPQKTIFAKLKQTVNRFVFFRKAS